MASNARISSGRLPTQRVLLLGASVRAAAESAARAGWQVIAADLFADQDLRAIAQCHPISDYPAEFCQVRQRFADTPAIYTGALENAPEVIQQVQDLGTLWGTPAQALADLRSPVRLQEVFASGSIPTPASQLAPPDDDQPGSWLRKPFRSAAGQRIELLERATPTTPPKSSSLSSSQAGTAEYYYQQHIVGQACSSAYVTDGHHVRCLGTSNMLVGRTELGASGFQYCGSIRHRPTHDEQRQWQRIGEVLVAATGLRGVFGVDAIRQGNQIVPVEVNPRYTASMELYESAWAESVLLQHARACLGQLFLPESNSAELPASETPAVAQRGHLEIAAETGPNQSGSYGKAVVFARHDGRIPAVWSSPPHCRLADVPHAGDRVAAGQPVLSLLAESDDPTTTWQRLCDGASSIYEQIRNER